MASTRTHFVLLFFLTILGFQRSVLASEGDEPISYSPIDSFDARDVPARTLRFPADRSLGTLKVRDWRQRAWSDWHADYREWTEYSEATGLVTIPAGKELGLWVTVEGAKDLSPLAKLRPGDVQWLDLSTTGVTDAQIKYVSRLVGLKTLLLRNAEITDAGLAHLRSLRFLERLHLISCEGITDKGLVHVGSLKTLTDLSVHMCRQVTDKGVAHLADLTRLEQLSLGYTKVTNIGLAYLKRLASLKQLILIGTAIDNKGLAHVGQLTSLRELWIGGQGIDDAGMVHLAGLTNLEKLYMRSTGVGDEGLAHLSALANLKELLLGRTKGTDAGLAHLAGLTQLERLEPPPKMSDAGLVHLKEMTGLKRIALQGTQATGQGLGVLNELDSLLLMLPSGVNDEILAEVSKIKGLKGLWIQNSPDVTAAGLEHLRQLPELEDVLLSGLKVEHEAYSILEDMPHLVRLNLKPARGTGRSASGESVLKYVRHMEKLDYLSLERSDVVDEDLANLQDLPSLRTLVLRGTKVGDRGLTYLKNAPALEWVGAQGTQVTEAGATQLPHLHVQLPDGKLVRPSRGASTPENAWQRYVQEFITTYQLEPGQQESAHSVLREMCDEAGRYQHRQSASLLEIDAKIRELGKKRPTDQEARQTYHEELEQLKARREKLERVVRIDMFNRLKDRLQTLPTQAQRNVAE